MSNFFRLPLNAKHIIGGLALCALIFLIMIVVVCCKPEKHVSNWYNVNNINDTEKCANDLEVVKNVSGEKYIRCSKIDVKSKTPQSKMIVNVTIDEQFEESNFCTNTNVACYSGQLSAKNFYSSQSAANIFSFYKQIEVLEIESNCEKQNSNFQIDCPSGVFFPEKNLFSEESRFVKFYSFSGWNLLLSKDDVDKKLSYQFNKVEFDKRGEHAITQEYQVSFDVAQSESPHNFIVPANMFLRTEDELSPANRESSERVIHPFEGSDKINFDLSSHCPRETKFDISDENKIEITVNVLYDDLGNNYTRALEKQIDSQLEFLASDLNSVNRSIPFSRLSIKFVTNYIKIEPDDKKDWQIITNTMGNSLNSILFTDDGKEVSRTFTEDLIIANLKKRLNCFDQKYSSCNESLGLLNKIQNLNALTTVTLMVINDKAIVDCSSLNRKAQISECLDAGLVGYKSSDYTENGRAFKFLDNREEYKLMPPNFAVVFSDRVLAEEKNSFSGLSGMLIPHEIGHLYCARHFYDTSVSIHGLCGYHDKIEGKAYPSPGKFSVSLHNGDIKEFVTFGQAFLLDPPHVNRLNSFWLQSCAALKFEDSTTNFPNAEMIVDTVAAMSLSKQVPVQVTTRIGNDIQHILVNDSDYSCVDRLNINNLRCIALSTFEPGCSGDSDCDVNMISFTSEDVSARESIFLIGSSDNNINDDFSKADNLYLAQQRALSLGLNIRNKNVIKSKTPFRVCVGVEEMIDDFDDCSFGDNLTNSRFSAAFAYENP